MPRGFIPTHLSLSSHCWWQPFFHHHLPFILSICLCLFLKLSSDFAFKGPSLKKSGVHSFLLLDLRSLESQVSWTYFNCNKSHYIIINSIKVAFVLHEVPMLLARIYCLPIAVENLFMTIVSKTEQFRNKFAHMISGNW